MVLTIEDLGKNYGEKVLFSHVNLNINEHDKIGIVGVNGTGKSTFLKTVAGQLIADTGHMVAMRNLRISFLQQSKEFDENNTVLMEVFQGDSPLMQALRSYESALAQTEKGNNSEAVQKALVDAAAQIDSVNGWSMESEAKTILNHLGIHDFDALTGSLSAGQQKRMALATALIQPCDLLILDEPTNHLDCETIGWLEEYLANWKGALLTVTHDRYFLDRVSTGILEFDKGRTYSYEGNYSQFLELKATRIEQEEAGERKRQNFLRNELAWIRRGAQARSTKQKARIQRYEEVRDQKVDLDHKQVEIGLAGSRLGRKVIELDKVSYEWQGTTYFKDFSYTVLRNDRIGILGSNGSGKTTLLNIIAGRLMPSAGQVDIGQTVKIGYFAQTNVEMDGRLRAKEYIQEAAHYITMADGTKLSAGQLMERFLFPPELQWTEIARLSGGEKRRLFLLRILMESPNVLLLDEPTNDLDLDTMAVLENFIEDFNGAIIFVSHDRFFTDRMAKKVFVVGGGEIRSFTGGYSDYKLKADEEALRQQAIVVKPQKAEAGHSQKRESKGLTFGESKEYAEIEAVIASKESELKVIEMQMAQNASDYNQLRELAVEQQRLTAELDRLMERWAYLEEKANE
ncbi:MAG: ABC-F family ATP-binding cassette domain-containing protein [Anaerovibrio sp.]|uniref:ABC-F family ATP-binding cassette domain-containing protein n=1 Tax=Anaerovibrio sp. TaxID=1872532 RepID=UPI0025D19986|nr:ABC-F family ATP-binding cassette domain-containing protein [Anaerovibrio sp.]MCR5176745.1 ABC-F family ATP-binding cassette domain-containing protein [Anaerovibrio sp.]